MQTYSSRVQQSQEAWGAQEIDKALKPQVSTPVAHFPSTQTLKHCTSDQNIASSCVASV